MAYRVSIIGNTGEFYDLTPSTITTGGTAVTIPADPERKYAMIQNPSTATLQGIATAESLFIRFTGTAAASSVAIELPAGATWNSPPNFAPTGAISIIGATTGHKFYAMGHR